MITIRKRQLTAFEAASYADFHNRLLAHLRRCFPEQCDALGDEGAREVIQQAHIQANSFGLETERDICLFTDLTMMLGRNFADHPELPWAKQILTSRSEGPTQRIERLYDRTLDELKRAAEAD